MIRRWRFAPSLPLGVQVLVPSEDGEWVSHHDHEAEIARVREDEAQGQSEALLKAQRVFLREGYAAALRDAVDAVMALYDRHDASCDDPRCEGPDREFAVAAIEALGGER